jgi:hypothetical protein
VHSLAFHKLLRCQSGYPVDHWIAYPLSLFECLHFCEWLTDLIKILCTLSFPFSSILFFYCRCRVRIHSAVLEGTFGRVYRGTYTEEEGVEEEVLVKTVTGRSQLSYSSGYFAFSSSERVLRVADAFLGVRTFFLSFSLSFFLSFFLSQTSFYLPRLGVEGYLHVITHSYIPQSVGLLWTRDRPVAVESERNVPKSLTVLSLSMFLFWFAATNKQPVYSSMCPQARSLGGQWCSHPGRLSPRGAKMNE